VDESGMPMPNKAFRVTDAAGAVTNGVTDSAGYAKVEVSKDGDCFISFPSLEDWDLV